MRVGVVIPALNEASTIAGTLRHTAGLGFDEIIVIDGGSHDQTQALVEAVRDDPTHAARSVIQLLSTSRGRAKQLNAGAKACRSDVLLFLHADTRLPDNARDAIERALADPDVGGGRFNVHFDSPSPWGFVISAFMNFRSRLTRIATGDQALFVRRQLFERLGGFADIPLMEDVDFSARLKRAGPTAALSESVTTSFRRWQQHGPLRTILLMWALRFLYWIGVSPSRLAQFYTTVR